VIHKLAINLMRINSKNIPRVEDENLFWGVTALYTEE
jgi:hypothetical protein